jgi:4-diphosphocytidyl-2-C-methyl-D-erythritol kinase
LVLVNPGVPLSTPTVFAARSGGFSVPLRWDDPIAGTEDLAARLRMGHNDLEAPARRLVPEIGEALAAIEGTADCLLARMSGSGATCFGLYGSKAAAEAARGILSRRAPGWWVRAAPALTDDVG